MDELSPTTGPQRAGFRASSRKTAGILGTMDEPWPASARAEEVSDSISSHAAEVERTLRALEAVEAFRAEAAALRAELHAARAPQYGRPAIRRTPGPELSASTWRLIVEAAFLVGIALACWAIGLHRLEIVVVMAGAWLLVAVLEAIVWHRTESVYRPVAPMAAPHEVPAATVAEPMPVAELTPAPEPDRVWPERSEAAEPTSVLPPPAPEADPEAEAEGSAEPEAQAVPEAHAEPEAAESEPAPEAQAEPDPDAAAQRDPQSDAEPQEPADLEAAELPRPRSRFSRLRRRRETTQQP